MINLLRNFLILNLAFMSSTSLFGQNIIQITNSGDSSYLPYPLDNFLIKACCNAEGDGAYCSKFELGNSIVNITSRIACIFAGIKLPANYFPTNCDIQNNGMCSFSIYPNQLKTSAVYKDVALKVVTNQNTQYYQYLPQGSAAGWPNNTPSQWGFDGSGSVNFNQAGNYLNAQLVFASPLNACSTLVNAAQVSGKIVLIQRGACEFGYKGLMAQNAGALGVIVYNNTTGYVYMGAGSYGASVTIPLLMVSQGNGQYLYNLLSQGESIKVNMGNLVP